jgi:hypothetical protein
MLWLLRKVSFSGMQWVYEGGLIRRVCFIRTRRRAQLDLESKLLKGLEEVSERGKPVNFFFQI